MATAKDTAQLGTEKINKLLKSYAIPAIIAMIATSLYNLTDSIFIGHGIGPLGIAGLAITFPLINLGAAFGSMVGIGAATLMSVFLGQKRKNLAQKVLGNVVILNIIIGILYTIFMLVFLNEILSFFGASSLTIVYARDYMRIILYGNVITHLYMGLNTLQRSAGFPKKAMYTMLATVFINIVLNYLFIFVFNLGIKGAAIATVASQALALIGVFHHFLNKKHSIHFTKNVFKLNKAIVGRSLMIGLSPFSMNFAACFVMGLLNTTLIKYGGDNAVAAFGIINRVALLTIFIVMGLTQGLQPIAGFNYGAKNYSRLREVLKKTAIYGAAITTFSFIIGQLFPYTITKIFTTDAQLIEMSAYALRIAIFSFPVVGYQIVVSAFFQSIGMPKLSIFMSLSRQVLLLVPLFLILPVFWGLDGIWFSFPIADALSAILATIILIKEYKTFKA